VSVYQTNDRAWFSGVVGPNARSHCAELFGPGELAASWMSDACALGYLRQHNITGATMHTDLDGGVTLSADVRLYNHRQILETLEQRGRAVAADAPDGLLLLRLYQEFGPSFAVHARGMFSAVVWDARTCCLILTRDAVGERPLYYAHAGPRLAFSSTLRSLRRWSALNLELDPDGVRKYLTYAFLPGESTLLKGVRELLPGHALVVELNHEGAVSRVRCEAYWRLAEGDDDPSAPIEAYSGHLRCLLDDCVRERLPAVGPVAVLLSGGLDSSAITALAARLSPSAPVHTFSISFGPDLPNELKWSSLVARTCGTTHHVLEVSGREIANHLETTVASIDDPIGDPLTVPNYLLDEAASEHSDAVLNGEGGDPCFGGPKNLPMLLHEVYGGATDPFARERSYLRSYQKCYDDLPTLLTADVHQHLATLPPQEALLTPYFDEQSGMRQYLNRLMLINVRLKGAHHILCKVDRTTASHGLEGRSPLFDRRVVEYSFQVPPRYKLYGTTEKAVLKRAVEDVLPASIIARPKSGMLVPVQYWFKHELRALARDCLLGRRARQRGIFNQQVLASWLDYRESVFPRHGVKLWLVLTLELWCRTYLDRPKRNAVIEQPRSP
jgi:asparagine synthase (glutamine-hydrolysing)